MNNQANFFSKIAVLFFAVFLLGFLSFHLAKAQGSGGSSQIETFCRPLGTAPNNQPSPDVFQRCVALIRDQLPGMNRTQAEAALRQFGSVYYSGNALNNFVNGALGLNTYQGAPGAGGGNNPGTNPANGSGNPGGNPGNGTGNPPNNSAGSSGGDCGNANLEFVHGLCLPKSSGSGLAAATDWASLATNIINILLTIAGTIAVLFLIVGGFWYITSGGNEETAEKGRKTLINALIGLVVVILSYVIVNVIVNLVTK